MSYPSEKIRLQFQLGVVANTNDAQTSAQGDAWRRTDWRFELSFARDGAVEDVSNFQSIRLLVMPDDARTGAALLDRSTSVIVPSITDEEWETGSAQQAVIEFTADETNLDLDGKAERTFYAVALVQTTDGKYIVAGYAQLRVVESGAWKDSQQPPQGGNIIPGGVFYDAQGEYSQAVTVGKIYRFAKGDNDTGFENGGPEITDDGPFTASGAAIVLKGTALAAVTAVVRGELYLTADESDARYLTHRFAVTQTGHGFAVGDVIRFNGTNYVKAKADSPENGEAFGIVEFVAGTTFIVVTSGKIHGLAGMTPGEIYYLSAATAGAITATEPEDVGNVSKPVLQALSASTGLVLHHRGVEIMEEEGGGGDIGENVFGEVPAGAVNGANANFTTANNFVVGSTRVFLNGLRQRRGGTYDYTEEGDNGVSFNDPPQTSDTILVDYIKA